MRNNIKLALFYILILGLFSILYVQKIVFGFLLLLQ